MTINPAAAAAREAARTRTGQFGEQSHGEPERSLIERSLSPDLDGSRVADYRWRSHDPAADEWRAAMQEMDRHLIHDTFNSMFDGDDICEVKLNASSIDDRADAYLAGVTYQVDGVPTATITTVDHRWCKDGWDEKSVAHLANLVDRYAHDTGTLTVRRDGDTYVLAGDTNVELMVPDTDRVDAAREVGRAAERYDQHEMNTICQRAELAGIDRFTVAIDDSFGGDDMSGEPRIEFRYGTSTRGGDLDEYDLEDALSRDAKFQLGRLLESHQMWDDVEIRTSGPHIYVGDRVYQRDL